MSKEQVRVVIKQVAGDSSVCIGDHDISKHVRSIHVDSSHGDVTAVMLCVYPDIIEVEVGQQNVEYTSEKPPGWPHQFVCCDAKTGGYVAVGSPQAIAAIEQPDARCRHPEEARKPLGGMSGGPAKFWCAVCEEEVPIAKPQEPN